MAAVAPPMAMPGASAPHKVSATLQLDKETREIGDLAVWSVTSAKPGNGVDLLRDGRDDTYWQSDGSQPHLVTAQFQQKVLLKDLALYMDFKLDESYTPQKISIRIGTKFTDLREIKVVELTEPQGWVLIPLTPEEDPHACVKAWILQLAILSNHQNGRDTHIRQVRVYCPRQDPIKALGFPISFTTVEFDMYSTVR